MKLKLIGKPKKELELTRRPVKRRSRPITKNYV